MNFDEIFMDTNSRQILDAAASGKIVHLHDFEARFLLSLGFISQYSLSEDGSDYVITSAGLRYEEFISKKDAQILKLERAEKKRDLRSWLTTAIAFLALILSLLSLLWQTYTWKEERTELPGWKSSAASTTAVHGTPTNRVAYQSSARSV